MAPLPSKPTGNTFRPSNAGSRPTGNTFRPAGATSPRPAGGASRPFQRPAGSTYQSSGSRPAGQSGFGNSGGSVGQSRGPGNFGPKQMYVNQAIKAPKITLIGEDGENLGLMSRDEAFRIADQKGYDLLQLSYNPNDMISTAKLIEDIGKHLYNKQKEEKEKKKQQKVTSKGFKEIKMGYAIGDHDLDLKLKKAEELLKEGWNVKCIVRLKGRERSFASKVIENLTKLQERMLHVARPQYPHPKQEAAGYSIILMPKTAQTHGK